MSALKYIEPNSILGLNNREIYLKYKNNEAFIGDSATISYINRVLKKYRNGKKN